MASENGKLGILDDKGNIKIVLKNDSVQQIEGTQLIQTKSQETIRNILKWITKNLRNAKCKNRNIW